MLGHGRKSKQEDRTNKLSFPNFFLQVFCWTGRQNEKFDREDGSPSWLLLKVSVDKVI